MSKYRYKKLKGRLCFGTLKKRYALFKFNSIIFSQLFTDTHYMDCKVKPQLFVYNEVFRQLIFVKKLIKKVNFEIVIF